MGVTLYLVGVVGGDAPLATVMSEARRLIEVEAAGALEDVRLGESGDGEPSLAFKLHPAAEDIEITGESERRLVVHAKTTSVGPGYHMFVCRLLRKLGTTLAVKWAPADEQAATGDPTGYFDGGRVEVVEREMVAWIGDVARRVLALPRGTQRVALSLPETTTFTVDSPVLTPLGPRDHAWLGRVAEHPQEGRDFFPWWSEGLGPDALLGRALCAMWTDVRWRAPLDERERKLLDRITAQLESAHRLDASLDYPWREWEAMLGWLGGKVTPLHELVGRRAARVKPGTPLIGYRRRPVIVALPGGWKIGLPGSFAESWDTEGTFLAGEPPRTLWVSTMAFRDDDGQPLPAERLFQTGIDERGERIEHTKGPLRGRAFVRRVAGPGGGHFELAGESAVPGALASCTISFEDPADRAWAIATWQGLTGPGMDCGAGA
jgi:hypothetical protein